MRNRRNETKKRLYTLPSASSPPDPPAFLKGEQRRFNKWCQVVEMRGKCMQCIFFISREPDDEQFSFECMRVGGGGCAIRPINFVFAFRVAFNVCQVYYSAIISVIRCVLVGVAKKMSKVGDD